tara:strand:+ start:362 stop:568 length:207 start_codon:yes stop_codon:yes gene_type:complete
MILNYTVKDFMTTKLITFLPKTPIEVAVGTFLKNKISDTSVINEKKRADWFNIRKELHENIYGIFVPQ